MFSRFDTDRRTDIGLHLVTA